MRRIRIRVFFIRQQLQGETELQPNLTYQHLFVVKAVQGAEPLRITNGFYSFEEGEWMPDGKEIVSATLIDSKQHPDRVQDSDLHIIRADGSNIRRLLDLPDYSVSSALPSPDGKSIAFVASRAERAELCD